MQHAKRSSLAVHVTRNTKSLNGTRNEDPSGLEQLAPTSEAEDYYSTLYVGTSSAIGFRRRMILSIPFGKGTYGAVPPHRAGYPQYTTAPSHAFLRTAAHDQVTVASRRGCWRRDKLRLRAAHEHEPLKLEGVAYLNWKG